MSVGRERLADELAADAAGYVTARQILVDVDQALAGVDGGAYSWGEFLRRVAAAGAQAEALLLASGSAWLYQPTHLGERK